MSVDQNLVAEQRKSFLDPEDPIQRQKVLLKKKRIFGVEVPSCPLCLTPESMERVKWFGKNQSARSFLIGEGKISGMRDRIERVFIEIPHQCSTCGFMANGSEHLFCQEKQGQLYCLEKKGHSGHYHTHQTDCTWTLDDNYRCKYINEESQQCFKRGNHTRNGNSQVESQHIFGDEERLS
jgi:hypothetical protein